MDTFLEEKKESIENTESISYNLHLVLFTDSNEMYERWFPDLREGFFQFADQQELSFLSVVTQEGQWYVQCKEPAYIVNVPVAEKHHTQLGSNQTLIISAENHTYRLYVSKVLRNNMVYHNYMVEEGTEISIGSQHGNDICCASPYISRNHAILRYSSDGWVFWDCVSLNGTYVNGVRCDNALLHLGDVVYIMGLRIIIGTNYISVNEDTGRLDLSHKLFPVIQQQSDTNLYVRDDRGICGILSELCPTGRSGW